MMLRTWPPYFLNRASYFKISNEHMLSWKINFIMTHFYRFLTVSSSYTNVALHCSCIEREASPHLRLFRPTHVKLTLQATGKAPFLWNVMWNIKACQYAIFWSSLICFAYLEFECQIMIFYQINYEYLYHNHKWAKLFQITLNWCLHEIIYRYHMMENSSFSRDLINLSNSFTPHLLRRFCRKVKQEVKFLCTPLH